jgi:branched-chain amino acid transport system ATP-binding protein
MLQLVDIHTYYGRSYVLQGVSIEVKSSSVVALLGRNGMGKTTTIHSIIGFTPPQRGKVIFKERDITGFSPHLIARMGMSLVPQGKGIFASLSVKENLTMASRGRKKKTEWNLEKVYSLFPILKDRSRLNATLLSGGEQQMLAIARSLMTNPELILMDEPSEGLSPIMVQHVGDFINQFHSSGLSILLVEQNLNLALAVADYIYILSQGTIVYGCTPDELHKDEMIKTKYLGVA